MGAVRGLMGLLLGPDRGRGERCGRAGEQEGEEEEEGDGEKEQCSMLGGGRGAGSRGEEIKKKGNGVAGERWVLKGVPGRGVGREGERWKVGAAMRE